MFQRVITALLTAGIIAIVGVGWSINAELTERRLADERVPNMIAQSELKQELRDTGLKLELEQIRGSIAAMLARVDSLAESDATQWPRLRRDQIALELLRQHYLELCREVDRRAPATQGAELDCVLQFPQAEFR